MAQWLNETRVKLQEAERAGDMTSFGSHISGFLRASGLGVLSVICAPLFLSGCGDERFEWHQKMTVTVETPEGVKAASSVVEVKSRYVGPETMGNEVFYALRGEAVTMEVAPGRYLFALLSENFAELYYRSSPGIFANPQNRGEWLAEIPHKAEVVRVPSDRYPLLVAFGDIDDPKSVRRVDPGDLAASFGTGYRLQSITLEITDDPVTEGRVEQVLGWLEQVGRERASLKGKPAVGRVGDQPDPQLYMISPSNFSTELYK